MENNNAFNFWYAVNNTEIVMMPAHHLETFGSTILNYHLISELMDDVTQVRVREGRLQAHQPQIITPEAYSQNMTEGFGDEAQQYLEWLRDHEKEVKILQYGYALKQESFSEHILTDNIQSVVERVEQNVKASGNPLSAVIKGVDAPWDVCLVKLFWEIIQSSAGPNLHELQRQSLTERKSRTKEKEIDSAFLEASKNPLLISALGKRLQELGMFEQYQDRFFSLIKDSKRK